MSYILKYSHYNKQLLAICFIYYLISIFLKKIGCQHKIETNFLNLKNEEFTYNYHKIFISNKKNLNVYLRNLKFSNVSITPKSANMETYFKAHIELNIQNIPGSIDVSYELFDPESGQSIFISEKSILENLTQSPYNFNFLISPLPTNILNQIKTSFVNLVFYTRVTDNKKDYEFSVHKDFILKIDKHNDDIIPFPINNNPVRNNTEKINSYKKMEFLEKKKELNKTLEYLNKELNKDENLQLSILISQYISSTKCEPNQLYAEPEKSNTEKSRIIKKFYNISNFLNEIDLFENPNSYHSSMFKKFLVDDCINTLNFTLEKTINFLKENFQCDKLENIIFNQTQPNNTIILTSMSVLYPSFNNLIFSQKSFNDHFHLSNCLISKGNELLKSLRPKSPDYIQNISQDFTESIFWTSSNIIETLSKNKIFINQPFDEKFSIKINDDTKKVRELVENQSKYLIENSFNKEKIIKSQNLLFLNEKLSRMQIPKLDAKIFYNDSNYSNYKNFTLKIDINDTDVIFSIPVDYILTKYQLDEVYVSAIKYNKYPLMQNSNKNFSDEVVSIKLYNGINYEPIEIYELDQNHPIKIYVKKGNKNLLNLNTCLFYDDQIQTWNDFKCKSNSNDNSDYIVCDCLHLTDFSFANFNPVDIYKDFIAVIKETRFIDSVEDFKYLSFSNAFIIYIYFGFFLIFLMKLFCLIPKVPDKKDKDASELFENNDIFYFFTEDDDIIIKKLCNKNAIERNIKISKKILENEEYQNLNYNNNDHLNESDNSLKTNNENGLRTDDKDNPNFNDIHFSSLIRPNENDFYFRKRILNAFKAISSEYMIVALFSDKAHIMNKINILFILFYDLINYCSFSSLLSPNNSISGDTKRTSYGYIYIKKKIAVYLFVIIFSKIPLVFMRSFLKKKQINKDLSIEEKQKLKRKIFIIYLTIYIIILIIYFYFFVNTLWISMINVKNKRSNDFIFNFMVSLFIKYLWIVVFILIKALLLIFFFTMGKSSKGILINTIILNIYNIIP